MLTQFSCKQKSIIVLDFGKSLQCLTCQKESGFSCLHLVRYILTGRAGKGPVQQSGPVTAWGQK